MSARVYLTTAEAASLLQTLDALTDAMPTVSALRRRGTAQAQALRHRVALAAQRPANEISRRIVELPREGVGMMVDVIAVEVDVDALVSRFARRAMLNKSRRAVIGGGRVVLRALGEGED